mmetsp:Transcript_12661/g.21450  ORF Transcript_12661/g.21450 Transcript_12661/m.21450 type:complete len:217 (+) Transcript_12661:262-912(+)
MELGEQTAAGLALCDSKQYRDEQVCQIAKNAVDALLGVKQADGSMSGECSISDAEHLQQMFAALVCTLVESAKMDLSTEELRCSLVGEHQMSGQRAQALADIFNRHKSALRSLLAQSAVASPIPNLVATDWRMDLDVAHSLDRCMGKKPLYHFTLSTQAGTAAVHSGLQAAMCAPGGVEMCAPGGGELRLAMCEEQLHELAGRLRAACRAAEANAA